MLFGTPVSDNASVSRNVQFLKQNYMSGTPVNVSCMPGNVSDTPVSLNMFIVKGQYLQLLAYYCGEGE